MKTATALEDVQRLLSSRLLVRDEPSVKAEVQAPVLPSVLADYLDELLLSGTEFPEQQAATFDCLHFASGDHQFLCPIDRIHRIEQLDAPSSTAAHRRYGQMIPDCEGPQCFALRLHDGSEVLLVSAILGVTTVTHEDVVWRRSQRRFPWFVGTHKSILCRIFDPNLLFSESENWRT